MSTRFGNWFPPKGEWTSSGSLERCPGFHNRRATDQRRAPGPQKASDRGSDARENNRPLSAVCFFRSLSLSVAASSRPFRPVGHFSDRCYTLSNSLQL
jgi:hypothetical protein